jgi:hypothetical protein
LKNALREKDAKMAEMKKELEGSSEQKGELAELRELKALHDACKLDGTHGVEKFKAELTQLRDLKIKFSMTKGKLSGPCPKCTAREAEDAAKAHEREQMAAEVKAYQEQVENMQSML